LALIAEQLHYPSGVPFLPLDRRRRVTKCTYDQDYRLTSFVLKNGAANVSSLAYAYSDNINLTGITDGVTPANSNTLSYTATNRLATATGNFGSSTYAYDGVGNRVSDVNTLSAVTKTRAFTTSLTSNRLTTITENAAAFRSYTYDGAGNILTDVRPGETFAFTYNKRNRPASVTRNSVAYATYGYNALEQLTTRTTSAVGGPTGQVAYIYDLEGHLIAEATASTGATTRDYIWMASNDNAPVDLPLAVAEAATLYMVHTDHLGRPIRMTDAAKATVWQATYKPFGEVQTTSGTKANNLRFPGQYFQIETSYAYNWHRHYDPISGRYTQPDPLRFVDGPSMYAYAGNSPWMNTDRRGLFDQGYNAGGSDLGHSDFAGNIEQGGPFDYNAEDTDPMTKPDDASNWASGRTNRHFRQLSQIELALNMALRACDRKFLERLLHDGQDYFVHAGKGFGPGTGHFRPGMDTEGPMVCLPIPIVNMCTRIPKYDEGHRYDHDPEAWKQANEWTKKWLDLFKRACDCQNGQQ
jgi:RHS repeat-associated protein